MDCVGCEKCRLWGKLQVTGIGAAMKILFSQPGLTLMPRLRRNEIVALFVTFGRCVPIDVFVWCSMRDFCKLVTLKICLI
jgi:hypothetical protein